MNGPLEVIIQDKNWSQTPIQLPEPIREQLLKYLYIGAPLEPSLFDCNGFAHYLNDLDFTPPFLNPSSWDMEILQNTDALHSGDTIAIGRSINNLTHLAVYLGKDLYISKGGHLGPIFVTDLNSMKMAFRGNIVFLIKPTKLSTF